jgi:SAM-dependent methyltransferase
MSDDHTLQTVCDALRSPAVTTFVRHTVQAGYLEYFSPEEYLAAEMVDQTFDRLERDQRAGSDPGKLLATTNALLEDTFKKGDSAFWFNRIYHHYKTALKPETDFEQLQALIHGRRVLDYGCGSGYLSARLARGGYQVSTTDVMDYRFPEARHLPFQQMASSTDIRYPENSFDTALVQAVLHHIALEDLPTVIQRLAKAAGVLVAKEDSYGLPANFPGLAETVAAQPLLKRFFAFSQADQLLALALIDYYANAIAQGVPEMNMPFAFKTVPQWWQTFQENGLRVVRTLVAGFEPGRVHKTCHVWFVCVRAEA